MDELIKLLESGNPYHKPKGPGGGQFTGAPSGKSSLASYTGRDYQPIGDWLKDEPDLGRHDAYCENLNDSQKESVREYTAGGFFVMNSMLRGKPAPFPEEPQNAKRIANFRENVAGMDSVFSGAPEMTTNRIVYRGVREGPEALGVKGIGQVFVDRGFGSTSVKKDLAMSVAKETFFEICVPAGSRGPLSVQHISSYPGEREIIFPRDSVFKVVSMTQGKHSESGKDITIVRLIYGLPKALLFTEG